MLERECLMQILSTFMDACISLQLNVMSIISSSHSDLVWPKAFLHFFLIIHLVHIFNFTFCIHFFFNVFFVCLVSHTPFTPNLSNIFLKPCRCTICSSWNLIAHHWHRTISVQDQSKNQKHFNIQTMEKTRENYFRDDILRILTLVNCSKSESE